jgi:hypothetical protein
MRALLAVQCLELAPLHAVVQVDRVVIRRRHHQFPITIVAASARVKQSRGVVHCELAEHYFG